MQVNAGKKLPCLQLDRGRQRSSSQVRHLLGGVGAVFGKLKRYLENKDVFQCLQMFGVFFFLVTQQCLV